MGRCLLTSRGDKKLSQNKILKFYFQNSSPILVSNSCAFVRSLGKLSSSLIRISLSSQIVKIFSQITQKSGSISNQTSSIKSSQVTQVETSPIIDQAFNTKLIPYPYLNEISSTSQPCLRQERYTWGRIIGYKVIPWGRLKK